VRRRDQILEVAHAVKEAGAVALRGGAFKPRTSPYSFQGLGEEGLRLLAEAREVTGLPVVTEVLEPEIVGLVADHADVIQIGARNMQNYPLLRRAGRSGRPVLLKRGLSATLTELLLAAEYVLAEGNDQVILCERGVRGFDSTSRNVLDLSAIPRVRARSHLPIIADPSHGTGVRELVPPMALAAVAAGADGLMVEVHPDPSEARSDGLQSLNLVQFRDVVEKVSEICSVLGRDLARVPTPAI
jgi:3-deoxy-7-phosphoheptulonate synthase